MNHLWGLLIMFTFTTASSLPSRPSRTLADGIAIKAKSAELCAVRTLIEQKEPSRERKKKRRSFTSPASSNLLRLSFRSAIRRMPTSIFSIPFFVFSRKPSFSASGKALHNSENWFLCWSCASQKSKTRRFLICRVIAKSPRHQLKWWLWTKKVSVSIVLR